MSALKRGSEHFPSHRPVRAGGSPEDRVPHDVICRACMERWPCATYLRLSTTRVRRLQRRARR